MWGQGKIQDREKGGRGLSDHTFNTPPDILYRVRRLDLRKGIGLDPCSNPTSMVNAATEWNGLDDHTLHGVHRVDGLAESWRGYGLVFMNPPHSMSPNNIEPWIAKAHHEFPCEMGAVWPLDRSRDQFVGLVPAKTDTAWFHDYVTKFQVRVFLRGRPVFWKEGKPTKGAGKFASMLIYAGRKPDLFREIFADMGWVV